MVPSMAGEFVPAGDDAADQCGMALRDPAEGEEGGVHAGIGEQLKHPVGVGFDPAFELVPSRAGHGVGEGLHLEVILDVHAHGVGYGFGG